HRLGRVELEVDAPPLFPLVELRLGRSVLEVHDDGAGDTLRIGLIRGDWARRLARTLVRLLASGDGQRQDRDDTGDPQSSGHGLASLEIPLRTNVQTIGSTQRLVRPSAANSIASAAPTATPLTLLHTGTRAEWRVRP